MRQPHPLLGIALFALAGALDAQTASYSTTRDGCNGTGIGQFFGQNETPMSFAFTSLPNDYAFAVVNNIPAPLTVLGFEFYTTSVTNTQELVYTFFYEDASGPSATVPTAPSATPVALGSMTVSGYQSWWSTSIYPPIVVQPGQAFWIGFFPQSRVSAPLNSLGTVGTGTSFYRRPNINGNRWTALTATGLPALRVRCTSTATPVPWLTNLTLPRQAQTFGLQLSDGPPNGPAFLYWSLSASSWLGLPTPVNMSFLGAPDCFIYTNSSVLQFLLLDGSGSGTANLAIPAIPALLGRAFYNQAVVTTANNQLGLATTNMGRGVIGT